jgi:site-specific DNA recombinase
MESKPNNSPPLRVAGYRRVSMRDQVDNFSLDAQENSIRQYAEKHGWQLVEMYVDAGISAKKGSHRPAFERLLKDASQDKFDVVVVDKIDRFYRHLNGLLTTLDTLNSYNVSFASVQEQLDFTSPWGKLMLTVLGTLAEIYLENLRQETRKGKRQRARQGYWLGAMPYGYCNGLCSRCSDPNGKDYCPDFGQADKGDGRSMVPHPVESQVVRQIFTWYASGEESQRSITDKLHALQIMLPDGSSVPVRQKGHPGRTEPGPFNCDLIRDMVKRQAYIGKVPYQGVADDGRHRKRQEPLEVFEANHPAIVDQETFDKAQEIRELRKYHPYTRGEKIAKIYPLTGVLRCSYCGGRMRGVSKPEGTRYYADANQLIHTCQCPQRLVHAEKIEQKIVQWINSTLQFAISEDDISNEQQLAEIEARFDRVTRLYISGELDRQTYELERNRIENTRNLLQDTELHAKLAQHSELKSQFAVWTELSQLKRKRLVRLVLERAYLRENAFVAAQPTFAFMPLIRPLNVTLQGEPKSASNCGEGGSPTEKDPPRQPEIFLPGTPVDESILVLQYWQNKH